MPTITQLLNQPKPLLMGVLNVTSDSFSDGGRFLQLSAAKAHAEAMLEAGADIIDVGGESTRPGAQPVSSQQELDRVLPIVEHLSQAGARVSLDTSNADLMRAGVAAGAQMINDTRALTQAGALAAAASSQVPICLMHMRGTPAHMQHNPSYTDVCLQVQAYLAERIDACLAAGIKRELLLADPGIGFGKSLQHNLELINYLPQLRRNLRAALLVGISRKSMLGAITGAGVEERLPASVASTALVVHLGAQIVRVHDVAANLQALQLAWELRKLR